MHDLAPASDEHHARAVTLFAADMHHVISRQRLRAGGLSSRALADLVSRGRLVRLRRGWYATADAAPAVVSAVTTGGRLTCISALQHYGAWTMPHPEVHVVVRSGVAVRHVPGRRLHWTHDRVDLEIPVEHPLDALALAVSCIDLRAAVVAIDSVLNRGIASRTEVEQILVRSPRGRRLLSLIDGRAESGIETLARLALRRRRLRVRPQVAIAGIARVDLLIGERLVLELDGREWHGDFEKDRARDRALVTAGYLVIRASYRQVMDDWPLVESQIVELVRRREHLWRTTLPQGARRPS